MLKEPLNPRIKISKGGRPYVETADLVASVLRRIAHCPRCGGELKAGFALQNTASFGVEDFPGAPDLVGQTFSYSGPAQQVKVSKCTECGYSRT